MTVPSRFLLLIKRGDFGVAPLPVVRPRLVDGANIVLDQIVWILEVTSVGIAWDTLVVNYGIGSFLHISSRHQSVVFIGHFYVDGPVPVEIAGHEWVGH